MAGLCPVPRAVVHRLTTPPPPAKTRNEMMVMSWNSSFNAGEGFTWSRNGMERPVINPSSLLVPGLKKPAQFPLDGSKIPKFEWK